MIRIERSYFNQVDSIKFLERTDVNNKFAVVDKEIQINGEISRTTYTYGINLRYGNPRFNFFAEAVIKEISEGPFYDKDKWETIAVSDFKMTRFNHSFYKKESEFILAYGGEFKLSPKVALNFAIRTNLNSNLKFKNLAPIASISCLMN